MSNSPKGSLLFVLHAHLPYVLHHGTWPHGAAWLYEAAAETYIPLLDEMNRLVELGHRPGITIGITPVLAEQLAHPTFVHEFDAYLQEKIAVSYEDEEDFLKEGERQLAELTHWWRGWFENIRESFAEKYNYNLTRAFRDLQDAGAIEIMTSCATHGYLPLLGFDSTAQAHVKQGVETYKKHFGRQPTSFWLPECAYRPRYRWTYPVQPEGMNLEPYLRKGVEEFLAENGLKCFFAEEHLLMGGAPLIESVYSERFGILPVSKPERDTDELAEPLYAPHYVHSEEQGFGQVAVYGREDRTGRQVWSADQGYPGDQYYLDFHKKKLPGAHRYWRVTGPRVDMSSKQMYLPRIAEERVREHAGHFVDVVSSVLDEHLAMFGKQGTICAPYDAELFGHWWFEGVSWLGAVLEEISNRQVAKLETASQHLLVSPPSDTLKLPEGSWGEGGFHHVWLNDQTVWTWQLIYDAESRMHYLSKTYGDKPQLQPLLKQCAREIFLLTSSDWQFNISTGGSYDYSKERLSEHFNIFQRLADMVERAGSGEEISHEDWIFLADTEAADSLFDNVQVHWFANLDHPVTENAPAAV